MKLKNFFCQFPNPWALRVSGMGCYTSKCEKKSKSLHPNVQHTEVLPQYPRLYLFPVYLLIMRRRKELHCVNANRYPLECVKGREEIARNFEQQLTRFFLSLCDRFNHGVTKRCRLSWPTNSAPSYMSPNAVGEGGGCGVSANEYSCVHGVQINFGDLSPY